MENSVITQYCYRDLLPTASTVFLYRFGVPALRVVCVFWSQHDVVKPKTSMTAPLWDNLYLAVFEGQVSSIITTGCQAGIMATENSLSFFHGVTAAYSSKILPLDRGNITHHFLSEDFLLLPGGMLHDPEAQGMECHCSGQRSWDTYIYDICIIFCIYIFTYTHTYRIYIIIHIISL